MLEEPGAEERDRLENRHAGREGHADADVVQELRLLLLKQPLGALLDLDLLVLGDDVAAAE